MSYLMKVKESAAMFEEGAYTNAKGNTECAFFVQQVTDAPATKFWHPGVKVLEAKPGTIMRGTAIATFDENGLYPVDALGKHAAIYLSHDSNGIEVLDQWNSQGRVAKRPIYAHRPPGTKRSNDADTFYVIE